MTVVTDLWEPIAAAGQTHTFTGAGVTTWASATIENDTTVRLFVSNSTTPPSGIADSWRIVPPGGIVTVPLGTAGVSYLLDGGPAAGGSVQTVLDTSYSGAGGNTGTVNIASGEVVISGPVDVNVQNTPDVTVTGPVSISSGTVDVQTAGGVNLSTAGGFAAGTLISINAGTTSQSIDLVDRVSRLVLLHGNAVPGGTNLISVTVTGDTTGARYFEGWIGGLDTVSVEVCGIDTGHGISVDPSVTVTIVASVGGGDLIVVQSYAPPGLTYNDLIPTQTAAPVQSFAKNLFVHEAHAKNVTAITVPADTLPHTLIAAPGPDQFVQVHRLHVLNTVAAANTVVTVSGGGFLLFYTLAAVGNYSFDCAGLTQNVASTAIVVQNNVASSHLVTVFYSLVSAG